MTQFGRMVLEIGILQLTKPANEINAFQPHAGRYVTKGRPMLTRNVMNASKTASWEHLLGFLGYSLHDTSVEAW
jgi:hypothetical protein